MQYDKEIIAIFDKLKIFEKLYETIRFVDPVKSVNDTYGHLLDDMVLKKFANILSECMGDDNNWIARYGGEEFMIGIHDYNKEQLIGLAECMRTSVEKTVFNHENLEIKLTASFGIGSIKDIENPSVSRLIDLADKNLYRAKNGGRNKVVY